MSISFVGRIGATDVAAPFAPSTSNLARIERDDALVVWVTWNADIAGTCVVTDTNGNVYQRFGRREFSGIVLEGYFAIAKQAAASTTNTVVGTITQTTCDASCISSWIFRGVARQGALVGVGGVDTPANATALSGPMTLGRVECVMVAAIAQAPSNGAFVSSGGGFLNYSDETTGGSLGISSLQKIASNGTYEASRTWNQANPSTGMIVALQMQPGSPVPVTKRRRSRGVSW